MPIPTLLISVLDRIPEPGNEFMLQGHLDAESYEVGYDVYQLPEGIDYDVVFTNTGGAVLLAGMARATAVGERARCLEPATMHLAAEVEGFYVFDGQADVLRPTATHDQFGKRVQFYLAGCDGRCTLVDNIRQRRFAARISRFVQRHGAHPHAGDASCAAV